MIALAEGRVAGKSLAAEIAALANRARELDAELHEVLGHPDQADWPGAMRAAVTAKRGIPTMVRVSGLTAELTAVQRQLADAKRRRELHAEAVAKERRQRAREHAAELLPEHRAIAGRMADAAEALLAAAEAEAELHDGLRRQFDHAPLQRLAVLDLRALRDLAKRAASYQAGGAS